MDNVITKSFDYSQIDESEFSRMENQLKGSSLSLGEISELYSRLYGINYYNKVVLRLDPPPLFIQCVIKLKKLGLNADPKIFESLYPELSTILEVMKNIKFRVWLIYYGADKYKYILHVNNYGTRTDYMWKDDYILNFK